MKNHTVAAFLVLILGLGFMHHLRGEQMVDYTSTYKNGKIIFRIKNLTTKVIFVNRGCVFDYETFGGSIPTFIPEKVNQLEGFGLIPEEDNRFTPKVIFLTKPDYTGYEKANFEVSRGKLPPATEIKAGETKLVDFQIPEAFNRLFDRKLIRGVSFILSDRAKNNKPINVAWEDLVSDSQKN